MASSRIFVRGLPPNFTEENFKTHFSKQNSITDAKLLPHRRIGYVGYKTVEDAEKAVKYFNKTFIRTSRIWVEIARPISDETLLKSRRSNKYEHASQRVNHTVGHAASSENPLKRKRPGLENENVGSDPKLKEFLEVMQNPSKAKTWGNEYGQATDATVHVVEEKVDGVNLQEGDSDTEYQVVSKKKKHLTETSKTNLTNGENTVPNSNSPPAQDKLALNEEDDGVQQFPDPSIQNGGPVSDNDWLRSRTSRLLGLEDDEDDKVQAGNRSDEKFSNHDSAVDEIPKKANTLTEHSTEELEDQDPVNEGSGDADEYAIRATRRLFLRNLNYHVAEDDLRKHFSSFSSLQEVHIPIDPSTHAGKGFAYIQFTDSEDAVKAKQEHDHTIFQGRILHILPATAKRESKMDEFAISQLPLKKRRLIEKKIASGSSTFNWNSLYMSGDAVMSSIADRLGVSRSELLDPTSADAAVKQAHAETHVISETRSYFATNGVDLDSFKSRARGDTAILIKNFPYGTDLRNLLEEHGSISRFLMPPSGTLAIVEFKTPPEARSAFKSLAYRKIKDSILFLEWAPKELFSSKADVKQSIAPLPFSRDKDNKLSAADLLQKETPTEVIETATLFVKNLSFETTTQRLTEIFTPLDGFVSARVKTKVDPKRPSQILSMGFGFLEFRTPSQAQAARAAMQNYSLDGHKLDIKASHGGMDAAEERRKADNAKKAAGKRTKIIIKNLPFQASKKELRSLLSPYGTLRSVRIPTKFDNSTRGFGFADFVTPREAENALDALKNTHFYGRRLVLDFASEDAEDAEEELEKMTKKVGSQVNKVALQRLTGGGRKKFNVSDNDDLDEA
ncbi:RNA-binding domain-containing protein [Lepidopterella palustris CBS 459.81]|uniref:Multiple RNA-binding domain-containing protein 1 n=1 Tax=Lepidopterella palustris CBS 459.81 TaxID=1314670 RepID=A0A8E2JJP9_9PEZI|nr:RNA-binding domain-containing protein [Lepidopterella palustris CBS 459.81]